MLENNDFYGGVKYKVKDEYLLLGLFAMLSMVSKEENKWQFIKNVTQIIQNAREFKWANGEHGMKVISTVSLPDQCYLQCKLLAAILSAV